MKSTGFMQRNQPAVAVGSLQPGINEQLAIINE
jgi:hypothetical protein